MKTDLYWQTMSGFPHCSRNVSVTHGSSSHTWLLRLWPCWTICLKSRLTPLTNSARGPKVLELSLCSCPPRAVPLVRVMSPQLLFASLRRQPYSTAQHIVCVSPASKTVMNYSGWKIRGFEQLLLLYHVSKLLQTIVQKFPLISETGGPRDRLEQQRCSLSHTWVKRTRTLRSGLHHWQQPPCTRGCCLGMELSELPGGSQGESKVTLASSDPTESNPHLWARETAT